MNDWRGFCSSRFRRGAIKEEFWGEESENRFASNDRFVAVLVIITTFLWQTLNINLQSAASKVSLEESSHPSPRVTTLKVKWENTIRPHSVLRARPECANDLRHVRNVTQKVESHVPSPSFDRYGNKCVTQASRCASWLLRKRVVRHVL